MFQATPLSSNVIGFGYLPERQQLLVQFRSGTYLYEGVPGESFERLSQAHASGASVGGYIAGAIRGKHKVRRLEPEEAEALRAQFADLALVDAAQATTESVPT